MIGPLCFVLAGLASPFKSKMRLEPENVMLRHQLIVLRRRLRGRRQNASVIGQRRAGRSPGSARRKHKNVPHPRRTPPPLPQGLGFRYTQASPRTASSKLRHESLGRSYAAEAVLLESLIAPLYLCMRVTVEALEDWRYVDAIDRVLEACLAGAALDRQKHL